jgi:hypothetical protein
MSDRKLVSARILQITPAPARLADKWGNIIAGYALCEFEWAVETPGVTGLTEFGRDILPFWTEGSIQVPDGMGDYYMLHALGDFRPDFADFTAERHDEDNESLCTCVHCKEERANLKERELERRRSSS